MTGPAVTVLMPVYNAEKYLRDAINSILTQRFTDFEFLIIDDGSEDGSAQIIASFDDGRIRFIQNNKNHGLIAALNKGIGLARGRYIARMDADDISHGDRLSRQFDFMETHNEVILCGTWFEMTPSNRIIKHPFKHDEIKSAMLDYCALGHPTTMFRRDLLEEAALLYDESFVAAEDYELWTRMIKRGQVANLPDVLLRYREHEAQVSAQMRELQAINTGRCRVKMLCLPLAEVTVDDQRLASLVLGLSRIVSAADLRLALTWLDKLSETNGRTMTFENFVPYTVSRKKVLIETFFYSGVNRYHPAVFYDFFRNCQRHAVRVSLAGQVRLILKCLCFYQKRS